MPMFHLPSKFNMASYIEVVGTPAQIYAVLQLDVVSYEARNAKVLDNGQQFVSGKVDDPDIASIQATGATVRIVKTTAQVNEHIATLGSTPSDPDSGIFIA